MKQTLAKLCSTLLGIVVLTTASYAQEQQANTETAIVGKIGIKAGVSFTNMYVGDDITDNQMKTSYHVGLFGKFPLTKGLSLQPELLYSNKGSKLNFGQQNGEYRFNLNYIELPVLLSVNVGENFHVNLGPYVGYLTKADVTLLENGDFDDLQDVNENDFNRWDLGAAAGIGFDINKFTIGARYNLGFSELNKSTLMGQILPGSKNNAIYVSLGFAF